MGISPKSSVIDPRGRVWDTKSLYVADAVSTFVGSIALHAGGAQLCSITPQSTFPTASGVNPMVTTMSVSHSIANFMLQDLE